MNLVFLSVFAASLAGSLHCAAMCGAFLAAAASHGVGVRSALSAQAAYHVGRLVTYLAFGVAAGLAGGALDVAGSTVGIGRASAFVAGAVLVMTGVSALFARSDLVPLRRRAPSRLGAVLGAVLAGLRRLPALPRAFLLGLSTTFVPCGWLYAFVATAAATGDLAMAVTVMLAFWAGGVPALGLAGVGWQKVVARVGARARVVSAALVVASGVLVLGLRIQAPAQAPDGSGPTATGAAPCPLHPR